MAESITPNEDETSACSRQPEPEPPSALASRKDKRKAAKKEKRKQIRKELAEKARAQVEARLNDPEEQARIRLEEERERERLERERKEFEEREKLFLEELARKKAEEEEAAESRKALEDEIKQNQAGLEIELNEDDEWEYVDEGPPEIIWKGNEIIVQKNRVKVKKKDAKQSVVIEDPNRPTSNPLPPQSEAYATYKDTSKPSAQQLLESVAQQVPNFGTEQDKAHCPFHIKTGACRFGLRCSRVHFYPDKSCTLLIKNMYTGPGLAWEQDEGLEVCNCSPAVILIYSYSQALHWRFMVLALGGLEIKRLLQFCTDEEVKSCYEEFYEDVHSEFLRFGEIVNFKVCRNGSFHLRGNVYVHYKSMDSAVLAYHSVNGRYFAGKQVNCEFVSLTKWKVAICGEYMKSRMKSCSRGTSCNFLHCFANPARDYEWADWDRPPPRYWMKEMTALFGYSDESWYDRDQQMEQKCPRKRQLSSSRIVAIDRERCQPRRSSSRSREADWNGSYARSQYQERDVRKSSYQKRHTSDRRKGLKSGDEKDFEEETKYGNNQHLKKLSYESDSDGGWSRRAKDRDVYHNNKKRRSRHDISKTESRDFYVDSRSRTNDSGSGEDWSISDSDVDSHHNGPRKRSNYRKEVPELSDDYGEVDCSELEVDRARKRNHSRRGHSSLEASEVSLHEEHINFPGHEETNNSSKNRKRTRSSDIDSRYNCDEDVDKVDLRESENESLPGKHKRSRRKLNIDENVMLDNAHQYHERCKSQNAENHRDEYNVERDRWKPDESSPEKDHRKSRRLLGDDRGLHGRSTGNRSQGSRRLSRERWSDSLKGVDSAEEMQKSEKDNKKGYREKQRSHSHNRNVEEVKTRTENKS